jgi:hypothetical protein
MKGADGKLTTDMETIVKILNDHFSLVFNPATQQKITSSQPNEFNLTDGLVNPHKLFSVSNFNKILTKLNTRKSLEPDGVHSQVKKLQKHP